MTVVGRTLKIKLLNVVSATQDKNLDAARADVTGRHFHFTIWKSQTFTKAFLIGIVFFLSTADWRAAILFPKSHRSDLSWLEVHTVIDQVLITRSEMLNYGLLCWIPGCFSNVASVASAWNHWVPKSSLIIVLKRNYNITCGDTVELQCQVQSLVTVSEKSQSSVHMTLLLHSCPATQTPTLTPVCNYETWAPSCDWSQRLPLVGSGGRGRWAGWAVNKRAGSQRAKQIISIALGFLDIAYISML